MLDTLPAIIARIDEKLRETGLSASAVSQLAVGNRDAIREIRRGKMPSAARMEKVAAVLGTTGDYLLTGRDGPAIPVSAGDTPALPDFQRYFDPREEPPTVPVHGTALTAEIEVDGDGTLVRVETIQVFMNDVIDHLRRPFKLIGRHSVYAIYFEGDSMEDRFYAGEPAFVDPARPPVVGDFVLVQLRQADGDDEMIHRVLAKRLVGRSASYIELMQLNPKMRFKVPREQVAVIHKILGPADVYAT